MATALDLITDSLLEIGVIAGTETPDANDATYALGVLNRIIDTWAAENLMIPSIVRATWAITASDGSYTIGSGGDIDIAWPAFVEDVRLIETDTTPDTETALVKLSEQEYRAIAQKDLTATQPSSWYYTPTYPLGALSLWPVPTSTTLYGALYYGSALSEFAALSTTVSVRPAYENALIKNLALQLARPYGRMADQGLAYEAENSRAILRRLNHRPRDVHFETATMPGGLYNIYTGE